MGVLQVHNAQQRYRNKKKDDWKNFLHEKLLNTGLYNRKNRPAACFKAFSGHI
jgi:hypothetical protein